MRICIFEDEKYANYYPLTLLRPVFALRCGRTLLYEKIIRKFKNSLVSFFMRDSQINVFKEKTGVDSINDLSLLKNEDLLVINGKWLFIDVDLSLEGKEEVGTSGDDILYVRIKKNTAQKFSNQDLFTFLNEAKKNLPNKEIKAKVISYLWDPMKYNLEAIVDDFKSLGKSGIHGKVYPNANIIGDEKNIYIEEGAEIYPTATLDAREGPIIIETKTFVYPNSWITGPVAIGPDNMIMGAKVREGVTIGPICRVGGEVEESIMHGGVNKWHDGFLGHAYVGEWVNLGADTINSDVKNDFSNVQVYLKGELTDTGLWKCGCFIGDHVKTSIGTLLNTGTIIGVMAIVVGSGQISPKFIPSFSWYINQKVTRGFGFNAALKGCQMQMSRRDKSLSEPDIKLLKLAKEITKEKREELIKKGRME